MTDTTDVSAALGTAIGYDDLPVVRHRLLFDKGARMMQRFAKRTEDTLDYFLDLIKWLEPFETITGATGWVDREGLYISQLQYAPTGIVVWLKGGVNKARYEVTVAAETSTGKVKVFKWTVVTTGEELIVVFVTCTTEGVIVGKREDPRAVSVDRPSVNFGALAVGEKTSARVVAFTNITAAPLAVGSVTVSGDFTIRVEDAQTIAPGEDLDVHVAFAPTGNGSRTGTLSATLGDTLMTVPLTGTGAESMRLVTSGNLFVTAGAGREIRLRSINWFGAEGTNYTPHGTWTRRYTDLIDQFVDWGFNCIRLPFSGDFADNPSVPASAINATANPEFVGKTALEIFDLIIAYCATKGVYVVLDHHRRTAGDGADGGPVSGTYTLSDWIATWQFMANRYAAAENVIGADLHNEPYSLTWDVWASYVEQCGNAIHEIAPDWIMFVQGVRTVDGVGYWDGGNLRGVANRPVVLTLGGRLAYSPHDYGQSVYVQDWLASEEKALNGVQPANWPDNLYAVFRDAWGYIFEQGIAPIWLGEFGGKFGYDGNGALTVANKDYERQWLAALVNYLNGDFEGDGTPNVANGGMSFAYWSLNPNSGDTGGLLLDDWETPQSGKLALIDSLLTE